MNNEIQNKLDKYKVLLLKWNKVINLISPNTTSDIWNRHFEDSLQLEPYIDKKDSVVDLGSGAGLPGIILSIIGFKVTLVEVDQKKVHFLKEVKRQLSLSYEIIQDRIENISDKKYDVITSRGLSSLEQLFRYSEPMIKENTYMVFLKGKSIDSEIQEAKNNWEFEYKKNKSKTSCEGTVLEVKNIRRK